MSGGKIYDPAAGALPDWLAKLPRPLVFTNGCFDILHRGHARYLEQAAELGAALLVGVNSDESARKLGKAHGGPFNSLADRMALLAALAAVDAVAAFCEETPRELILQARPEVLVKGGDWAVEKIVGADEVRAWGGEVHSVAFEFERSTTGLVERIRGKG
ncbi:MAG: adenylyltransferase/cytidyltransferase family protein [Gammaproteobacteria bacterium]|nr:adenylyltransferase/cytidyltransferase family protein [Gammaproteobacteria bacterium]MDA8014371.1 adenylyltransferase/cytidyltransferase family protein [Gammaproteobacteria bacterium]